MAEHEESGRYESEDDEYEVERKPRKSGRKVGGIDLDQEESHLRKAQQEAKDSISSFQSIRTQSQSHTKRINELQLQFEEARVRIDKLLSRKSRTRSDFDLSISTSRSDDTSVTSSTKFEIQMAPQKTFAPVSLTVKVDDSDED